MLLCVCSVIDHRGLENVVQKSVTGGDRGVACVAGVKRGGGRGRGREFGQKRGGSGRGDPSVFFSFPPPLPPPLYTPATQANRGVVADVLTTF